MSAPGPKPASTSCCGIRTFATASCFETAALRPLQGEVLNPHGPHGEERGNAAHLEPCSHGLRCDHHSIQRKTAMESNLPSLARPAQTRWRRSHQQKRKARWDQQCEIEF